MFFPQTLLTRKSLEPRVSFLIVKFYIPWYDFVKVPKEVLLS